MPIRFRCPGCDGLLSIASRKAGTEVACPKCREGLIVPNPVEEIPPVIEAPFTLFGPEQTGGTMVKPKAEPKVRAAAADEELVFEQSDFERLLEPAIKLATVDAAKPQEVPAPPPGFVHVAKTGLPVADNGVYLSRRAAVALGAGFAVMLVVAFVAGFLVGR